MPTYDYICECGNKASKLFSMKEYKQKIKCKSCSKMMKLNVRENVKSQNTIIPEHMSAAGSAGDNQIKYDKSPSKKKHYW